MKTRRKEISMKRKIAAILAIVMVSIAGVGNCGFVSQAEEMGEDLDYSYLMTDSALVGYAEAQTWGAYLASGNSIINKISSYKIGAGGTTTAATKCKVSITSIVERKTDTGWARVTSWTQTNENAFTAGISKSLTVGTGYYYRVRSAHYAASDVSSSCTGALYM